jgi:hypothetical protein
MRSSADLSPHQHKSSTRNDGIFECLADDPEGVVWVLYTLHCVYVYVSTIYPPPPLAFLALSPLFPFSVRLCLLFQSSASLSLPLPFASSSSTKVPNSRQLGPAAAPLGYATMARSVCAAGAPTVPCPDPPMARHQRRHPPWLGPPSPARFVPRSAGPASMTPLYPLSLLAPQPVGGSEWLKTPVVEPTNPHHRRPKACFL